MMEFGWIGWVEDWMEIAIVEVGGPTEQVETQTSSVGLKVVAFG